MLHKKKWSIWIFLLGFVAIINIITVGAQEFSCAPSPGAPLVIETSSSTPITITSDPLTCSVTVRNLNAPSITFLGVINDPSISITVDGVTCTGTEDICVLFSSSFFSFNTISINNVNSIYDNSLASPTQQNSVNNVQLVAFLGDSTRDGNAIIVANCNFNAIVVKTSTIDLQFGLFLMSGLASFIRDGITIRDSSFVARMNDAARGPVKRFSLRFAGGIDSTDLFLHRLHLVNNNSSGCDEGLSFFHISIGSMTGRSGLSIKNVFARTVSFVTGHYMSSSFITIDSGSSTPTMFAFEDVDYRIEPASAGQTETFFQTKLEPAFIIF
jgi:hypothetical protein